MFLFFMSSQRHSSRRNESFLRKSIFFVMSLNMSLNVSCGIESMIKCFSGNLSEAK